MARMTLRLYRPFEKEDEDPWHIQPEDEVLQQFEDFMRDPACPGWLIARYRQHNRVQRRKRKSCECCDAGDETAPGSGGVREGGNSSNCDRHHPEATAVDGEDGDDEMEQSGLPSKYEAHPPHDNNAEGGGGRSGRG